MALLGSEEATYFSMDANGGGVWRGALLPPPEKLKTKRAKEFSTLFCYSLALHESPDSRLAICANVSSTSKKRRVIKYLSGPLQLVSWPNLRDTRMYEFKISFKYPLN